MNSLEMFTRSLLLILFISLSGATRNPINTPRNCERREQKNAGRLLHQRRSGCSNFTLTFNLASDSTLVLSVLVKARSQPIVIQTRSSQEASPREVKKILFLPATIFRFESPIVQIVLPSDMQHFEGRYKILSRPVGRRFSFSNRMGGSCVDPPNSMVDIQCRGTNCGYACKHPDFVPVTKTTVSVPCGVHEWRQRVDELCMPRASLGNLCFDKKMKKIQCEYTVEDILSLFEREESEAGDSNPDFTDPRGSIHVSESYSPPRKGVSRHLIQRICRKRLDTHRFKHKCSDLNRRFITICLYVRHLSNACSKGNLFS